MEIIFFIIWLAIVVFAVNMVSRLVRAHESIAASMDELARKSISKAVAAARDSRAESNESQP